MLVSLTGSSFLSEVHDTSTLRTALSVAPSLYLRARKARLKAELKQSDTLDLPRGPTAQLGDALAELAMQQEVSIFQVRREAFLTQMRVLERLKGFLDKEVVSLVAQRQTEGNRPTGAALRTRN